MEETKSYKNINLNELRQSPEIVKKTAKIAMFVPRLIAKLSTKLVINPITKLYAGQDYEQVKTAAIDLTMQMQETEAQELKAQIDKGIQTLSDFKEDREYYIGNLAKYKAYQTYIEKLSKKYNKLVSSPKRLLVAKNYLEVMKAFKEKNKEIKQNAKLVQQIVDKYQERNDEVIAKRLEVKRLEEALAKAKSELNIATGALNNFKKENYEIISQLPGVMGEAVEQEVTQVESVENTIPEPVQVVEETPVLEETEVQTVQNNNELYNQEPNEIGSAPLKEPIQKTVEPTFKINNQPVQNTVSQMPEFNIANPMANLSQTDQDLLAQMGMFGSLTQTQNFEEPGKRL